MKQDEFFKIIGIIIVGFFIIYMATKMFQLQTTIVEGMTNNDTNVSPSTGEAGTSSSYAAAIKAQVVKLQDELLIAKYRKEYESVIINLDDYIGYLMIQQTLNMKLDGNKKDIMEAINNLNSLKTSKDALNATMTFLDKQ